MKSTSPTWWKRNQNRQACRAVGIWAMGSLWAQNMSPIATCQQRSWIWEGGHGKYGKSWERKRKGRNDVNTVRSQYTWNSQSGVGRGTDYYALQKKSWNLGPASWAALPVWAPWSGPSNLPPLKGFMVSTLERLLPMSLKLDDGCFLVDF